MRFLSTVSQSFVGPGFFPGDGVSKSTISTKTHQVGEFPGYFDPIADTEVSVPDTEAPNMLDMLTQTPNLHSDQVTIHL